MVSQFPHKYANILRNIALYYQVMENLKNVFCFVLLEGVSVFGQRGGILIFVDLKVIAMARNIYLRSVVMHHKS